MQYTPEYPFLLPFLSLLLRLRHLADYNAPQQRDVEKQSSCSDAVQCEQSETSDADVRDSLYNGDY
jgi:hypothetical protein